MLTGNPPHVGSSAQQIIMKIIAEPVEPVTKYRKSVPSNVAAAVAKSLEKLPADRFETPKAFADALGNASFTTMHATVAGGRTPSPRLGNPWLVAAMGVVFLAAGIGVGALLTRRPPPVPRVVRFTLPMNSGQHLYSPSGAEGGFALSPDGTRIAYLATDSGAAQQSLHVRALDQFTTTSFPGTEGAAEVFWSPDGLWIGVVTDARAILKVSVSGGPVSQLATGADRATGAPSWGDNHFIAFTLNTGWPAKVSDGGGTPAMLTDSLKPVASTTPTARGAAPVLLPGSRALLMSVCRGVPSTGCERDLGVVDLATGKVTVVVQGATRGWYLPGGYLLYGTREGALFAVRFDAKSLTVTSAPVAVLDGVETSFAWLLPKVVVSASGAMAYLPGQAGADGIIVQVDRTGHEEPVLTKPGSYAGPRFSPDGRRIALVMPDAKSSQQIWIHDRASVTTRQLTFDGANVRPTWSPDGNRVAFSGTRANKWNTWWIPADGSGLAQGASEGRDVVGASAVSWTRDGKWIIVDGSPDDRKGAGGEDVFAIPTSGTPRTIQPVVASPFNEQSGEVSPDGKWIAYASDDAGKYQVYIQPFMAPGGRTLISAGRASEAVWLSNTELAYIDNEADSLTLARLEFGPTVKVTRTALFDTRNYLKGSQSVRNFDVSPDGKSFMFVKPRAGKAVADPVIVLNWTEEVKRLMAAAGIK